MRVLFRLSLLWIGLLTGSLHAIAQEVTWSDTVAWRSGDTLEWAAPEFDDQNWARLPAGRFPQDGWTHRGWFRFEMSVPEEMRSLPLGISIEGRGAIEVYLDGQLIAAQGVIGNSQTQDDVVVRAAPTLFFLPQGGKESYTVAVRYSGYVMEEGIGMSPEFSLDVDGYDRLSTAWFRHHRSMGFHQAFLMGINWAFALLHFLLFVFYRKLRANLYMAGLTLFTGLLAYLEFEVSLAASAERLWWVYRGLLVAGVMLSFLIVRFAWSLTSRTPPRKFNLLLLPGVVLVVAGLWQPGSVFAWLFFYMAIMFLEASRVFVYSLLKHREQLLDGSWLIALGSVPFIVLSLYQILGVLTPLWSFLTFPIYYYPLVVLLSCVSIFLARNFAQTHRTLEHQIRQIETLSEETLRQEMDRIELEAENHRKSHELEEALTLQLSMLPKQVPKPDGFEIEVSMHTATEVGGDYYDFYTDKAGVLTIAIGDATGHGLQAGTMVAATKSLFSLYAEEPDLCRLHHQMSQALAGMGLPRMFMALMIARLEGSRLSLCSAGIPHTLLYRKKTGQAETIVLKGLPLGSGYPFPYQTHHIDLEEGDTVLLMSDGLGETFNERNEMLGLDRALSLFAEVAEQSPTRILGFLEEKCREWAGPREAHDDTTLMVLKMVS